MTVWRLMLLALVGVGAPALGQPQSAEQRCERGDRKACHQLGLAATADGGERASTQAWMWLGRGCDLGEAAACDDAAKHARASGRWTAADSYEEEARKWRSVPGGVPEPRLITPPTVAEQQCLMGDRAACHRVGVAYARANDTVGARLWLGRACKLGERAACTELGTDAGPIAQLAGTRDAGPIAQLAETRDAGPIAQLAETRDAGAIVQLAETRDAGSIVNLAKAADAGPFVQLAEAADAGAEEPPDEVEDAGAIAVQPRRPDLPPEAAVEAILEPRRGPTPPPPMNNKCLSDEEYARNRSVLATRNDPTAFRPSALWLPPLYMTDAERSYTWAGLLYFQSLDFDEGTRTRVVPPFFVSHCSPESQTLLTPFYSYRTDAEGTASLYFTYFRRRDRLVESDVLFPIAWSLRERTSEDAPWVGSGAFLPFAFWKRDPNGSQFTIVPPLFWRWGDDAQTTTVVGNVYLHRAAERMDLGVVPFYFRGRSKTGDYDISPLLFWSFRDEEKQSLFIPPLLTWYQSRPTGFTLTAFPLLFVGEEGSKFHTFLPPLFWRWGDGEETTTIAANVFWHENNERTDLGIVPLYFRGRSATGDYDVSPLLFWSFRDDKKHSLFLPPLLAYHQSDGETSTTWAINTWYQSRPNGFSLTVFPLLFSGREADDFHVMVPPLFWMWGDTEETTTVALNVFWHQNKERTDLGIVPLYFRGRSATGDYDVSPLLFWSFRDGRKHTLFLPPVLGFHHSDGETSTTWAVNTWFQSRPNGFTLNFVPLLFAGKEGDDYHAVVPPLFARWGDTDETTTIAANVFWHESKTRLDWGIVPLYFHGSSGPATYDISPLLFWSFREGPRHSLFLPALLTFHQTDGETSTTWALNTYFQTRPYGFTLNSFPFLFMGQDGDAFHTVLAPFFWRWGDNDETTTIAGPVYVHNDKDRTHFGVAPLYFGGRSTAGEFDVSPLLFWSFREGLRHRLVIPPLLGFHENDGVTYTTWALNTYFQSRPTGFTLSSIPLLFAGREGENFHAVVPPALFFRWGDDDTTTTIAGPVFWRSTPERFDVGIIPLYFGGPGYDVSPFLFWSFHDGDEHSLLIPPLLTWYQSRTYGFTLNSFPLLFVGQDGDTHHTFVPPALFFRWGDADETTTIAGPVYWRDTKERFDFGVVPLFFHGPGYDVSPLLFWSLRDGPRKSLLIPPLLTYYETDGETQTLWAINTWYQSKPYGFSLMSFPFLFLGRDGDAHHTVVPPLFWQWGDNDETTTIAGNVFFHRSQTRWDFGIAPLFFSGRSDRGDYDISPPLFWSYRNGPHSSLLIPPLLTYYETNGETETAWVLNTYFQSRPYGFSLMSFPFLFAGQDGEAFHTFLPPLFWYWGDDKERTTIAGPLYWHEHDDTSFNLGLVPLYFMGRSPSRSYDISPMLFWSYRSRDKWSLLLPALLSYVESDHDTTTVWAINTFFQSRPTGFTLNVVPFLFAGEEGERHHTFLPPLFWRWGDNDEKTTIVGNVFWHGSPDRTDWGIVPLYFHGSSVRGGTYDISPALFWSFRDGPKHSLLIPPLLTYHQSDGEQSTTWALNTYFQSRPTGFTLASVPLLFVGREGKEHHTIVPPLFWRWGDGETDTTIVGTFFNRSTPTGSVFGLAPLYFGGRGGETTWDLVPPLFFRSATGDTQHITMPPFFDYHSTADSKLFLSPLAVYSKTPDYERTVVAGLYWNMTGPDLEARIVAPLWWDFKSKKKGTRVTTVFPLYWRYEKPEETTHLFLNFMYSYGENALGKSWSVHLFPFFDLVSYHPKHFLWQLFAGMFGRETQDDSARWRIGWVWTEPTKRAPSN